MASSPLLSVATELLLAVVEAIDDAASLRSFALTCKLARLLAEPVLYRAVLVTTGSQASRLADALQQQHLPTRAELVQVLDLRPDRGADVGALTPLVGAMTRLRALSMESPFEFSDYGASAYRRWWEALMQGYRALFLDVQFGVGLQNLERLTIHWSGAGSRIWLLTEFKPILTLPALQSLTVSCAVLGDDLADGLAAFAGTTPLTHLELIECFVSQKALTAVLALPRALRSCHQGIVRHQTSRPNTYQASPEQQLAALSQQRHSLQQLTWFDKKFAYGTGVRRVSTVPGRGLCDFTELHTLTLDGASALFFSTLLSECAPPNLDRLRIIRHDNGTVLDHPIDSVAYTHIPGIPPPFSLHQHLPKLHHFDLVFSPHRNDAKPLWAKPDRRDYVKRLGEDYYGYGIRLSIFVAYRGYFIPPYLFGEEVPYEEPAYRAENAWFSPRMT
ncbi:hypothetical protein GGX14DRAFT_470903 [Mycena pura]|uniref:F-box domain-containing protein n=1 Tax=Mycena pura TaxID=153505 RepID=A0AAD6Y9H7_9AGAR|nr:hypothetical protein GGX14DRAFT_470903 [Mycena pura]